MLANQSSSSNENISRNQSTTITKKQSGENENAQEVGANPEFGVDLLSKLDELFLQWISQEASQEFLKQNFERITGSSSFTDLFEKQQCSSTSPKSSKKLNQVSPSRSRRNGKILKKKKLSTKILFLKFQAPFSHMSSFFVSYIKSRFKMTSKWNKNVESELTISDQLKSTDKSDELPPLHLLHIKKQNRVQEELVSANWQKTSPCSEYLQKFFPIENSPNSNYNLPTNRKSTKLFLWERFDKSPICLHLWDHLFSTKSWNLTTQLRMR